MTSRELSREYKSRAACAINSEKASRLFRTVQKYREYKVICGPFLSASFRIKCKIERGDRGEVTDALVTEEACYFCHEGQFFSPSLPGVTICQNGEHQLVCSAQKRQAGSVWDPGS